MLRTTGRDGKKHRVAVQRRRHNSSQATSAEANRAKLVAEYAAEVGRMKAEAAGKRNATLKKGARLPVVERIPPRGPEHDRKTNTVRARAAGTNRKYLEAAEDLIEKHPQQAQAVERGEKTIPQVQRELRAEERKSALQAALDDVRQSDFGSVAQVRCCRMDELLETLRGLDAIITAPPYSEEYLPLYGELARLAKITNATDLWHVKKVNPQSMIHLTEKPVELAVRAMTYSSKPGENVLDLFGGSGSTLIAAEKTGRRAYLMELDELYADVIVKRWEEFTGRKAERHPAESRSA